MGCEDLLLGKRRPWMALKGLRKRHGPARRKLPTTPAMLEWIRGRLDPEHNPDDAILWGALCLAFFFLMRVGEYAHSGGWDLQKVLTPADVRGKDQNRDCRGYGGDEVQVFFKQSKADQEGFGCMRNHYRSGGELCPVKAMQYVYKRFPHRWEKEADRPLFRWGSGAPLTRAQIQAQLELAGAAAGLPPDRFRSHSLRIGGATALYHIFPDAEVIKRWGRWKSTAFQAYLWDANEQAQGVSGKWLRIGRRCTSHRRPQPSPGPAAARCTGATMPRGKKTRRRGRARSRAAPSPN